MNRAFVAIGLPTLLAVLSYCAIHSSLRTRGAKLAELAALAAACLMAFIACGRMVLQPIV